MFDADVGLPSLKYEVNWVCQGQLSPFGGAHARSAIFPAATNLNLIK